MEDWVKDLKGETTSTPPPAPKPSGDWADELRGGPLKKKEEPIPSASSESISKSGDPIDFTRETPSLSANLDVSVNPVGIPVSKPSPTPTLGNYLKSINSTPEAVGLSADYNPDKILTKYEKDAIDTQLGIRKGLASKQQTDDTSYFWGLVKNINIGTANVFKHMDTAAKALSDITGLENSGAFGKVADYIYENKIKDAKDVPDNVMGDVLAGAGQLEGLFLELLATPQLGLLKLPANIAVSGALDKYGEVRTEDIPTSEKVKETAKAFGVGAGYGALFTALGVGGGVLNKAIVNKTGSKLIGYLANLSVNAGGFGGLTAVEGGDKREVIGAALLGGVLTIPEAAKLAYGGVINRTLGASDKAIKELDNAKIEPEVVLTKIQEVEKRIETKKTDDNIKAEIDASVTEAQQRLKLPAAPEVITSDVTKEVLGKIETGEPITNDVLKQASDDLYTEYKRLRDSRESTTRQFTVDQINESMRGVEEQLNTIETIRQSQTETGEFVRLNTPKEEELGELETQKKVLENALVINAGVRVIKDSPGTVIDAINESELTPTEKKIATDKVNNIVAETDPIREEIKPLIDEAGRIEKQTELIENNTALSKTEKAARTTPLKKRNKEIQAEIEQRYSKSEETKAEPLKPGEEIKVEPLKEGGENAISKRIIEPVNKSEYTDIEAGRKAAETGGGNRVEQGGEITQETQVKSEVPQEVRAKFQSIADKIRSNKIQPNELRPTEAQGLDRDQLWNDALEAAAKTMEITGDVAQAISDGVALIKNEADKEKFAAFMNDVVKDFGRVRQEDTAKIREEIGMGEYERTPKKIAEIKAEAQRKIKDGYNVNELKERIKDGEPPTDVEQAILGEYLIGMKERAAKDPSDANLAELRDALDANDIAGSIAGRNLRMRQASYTPEASSVDMMLENMTIVGSDKLTEAQKSQNKIEFDEISKLKDQLEGKLKQAQEENIKLRAEREFKRQRGASGPRKTKEQFTAERAELIKLAKENWAKASQSNVLSSTIVPLPYAQQLYAISPQISGLVRSYATEGVYKLQDVVAKIKEDVGIKEITDSDVLAMIAGEYRTKPVRSELAKSLQNLRAEARDIRTLEKLLANEPASEAGKIKRNKQVSDTKKKINELRRSAELNGLTEVEWGDAKKLQSYKNRMKNDIAKIEKELESSEPIKIRKPEPIKLDKEGIAIQDQLISARQKRKARMMAEQFYGKPLWNKISSHALDMVTGTTRGMMATADLSMALLQNGVVAMTHPIYWGRAFGPALRDMVSEKHYNRWMEETQRDRKFAISIKAGLALSNPKDPSLLAAEELLRNNLVDKIPILGKPITINGKNYGGITQASSRVFSSMSNRIRVNMMYHLIDVFELGGKTIENSPKLYKATARLINAATGRADFGRFEKDMRIVSNVLWSPRMYLSQLELLTSPLNPYYVMRAPKEVRNAVLLNGAKYIGASVALLGLASLAGADVETSPTSKDFGKIRIGNLRFGLPGSMTQWIVLASQYAMGEMKSTVTGKTKHVGTGYNDITRMDILSRFFRGKVAPTISLATDVMSGQTYMGEDVTVAGELGNYLVPLSAQTAYETSKYEGVGIGAITSGLNVMGVSAQNYPATGWYPNQTYGEGEKKTNALGEKVSEIDKAKWDFLNQYKIDVSPPNKSTIKYYDEKKKDMEGITKDQYIDFIKARGQYISEALASGMEYLSENKESFIDKLLDTKYADGTSVYPDREMAEKALNEVFIPEQFKQMIKNANEYAKTTVIQDYTPPKADVDLLQMIEDYKEHEAGRK